jgi:hypothetical protein
MKSAVCLISLVSLLLAASPSFGAPVTNSPPVSDPEMKQIYDADQADRSGDVTKFDSTVVSPRDAKRRQETARLLNAGQLHTGLDFAEAALVFQHGDGDDFLLAHTLAVIATKKGDPGGPWLTAATLDRYLQSTGRKQIYGTQTAITAAVFNKAAYDRDLISDALRHELGVPDLASQDAQLKLEQAQHPAPSATVQAPAPATRPPLSRSNAIPARLKDYLFGRCGAFAHAAMAACLSLAAASPKRRSWSPLLGTRSS